MRYRVYKAGEMYVVEKTHHTFFPVWSNLYLDTYKNYFHTLEEAEKAIENHKIMLKESEKRYNKYKETKKKSMRYY